MRILLQRCAWILESIYPWRLRRGPLDLLLLDGSVARISASISEAADVIVECRGEYGAAPCFYDALYVPRTPIAREDRWIDELLEDIPGLGEEDAVRLARLGFCRGLAYAAGGSVSHSGVVVSAPRLIVKPSGETVETGGRRFTLAATGASRRSVYALRSRTGRFAVEYLEARGLLSNDLVVIGPWVSSWEFQRLREVGARVVIAPWLSGLYRGGVPPSPAHLDVLVAGSGGVSNAWQLAESLVLAYSVCYWGGVRPEEALKPIASSVELLGGSSVVREGVRVDLQVVESSWEPGDSIVDFISSRPRIVQLISSGVLVEQGVDS